MSGSLRICAPDTPPVKHDHVDFVFGNGKALRLRDPRRFGAVLWTSNDPFKHKLLIQLGPEPLGDEFNVDHLHQQTRKRSASIKSVIMNSHIVVGVGNIYACEALFIAGINPKRKAGTLSKARCEKLVSAIRQILNAAIEQGGTTLRDFVREDGQPGYFKQHLYVYGRTDQPCLSCGANIRQFTQQQRSTFYCARCQK
jgi:formamidopyrimidine-DNA glycosylase